MSGKNFAKAEIKTVRKWIADFYPAGPDRPGDPSGRARLRRAESLYDIVAEPAFQQLVARLRKDGLELSSSSPLLKRLALAAGAILTAKELPSGQVSSLARALGYSSEGGEPRMSPLRFDALVKSMTAGEEEERLRSLRRAVALLGDGQFSHRQLIGDIVFFDETTRIRWVYDYFQSERDEPDAAETTTDANEEAAA